MGEKREVREGEAKELGVVYEFCFWLKVVDELRCKGCENNNCLSCLLMAFVLCFLLLRPKKIEHVCLLLFIIPIC